MLRNQETKSTQTNQGWRVMVGEVERGGEIEREMKRERARQLKKQDKMKEW